MKTKSSALIAVLFLVLSASNANAAGEIQWAKSMSHAHQLAKEQNKPILIHFWATWCNPCLALNTNVFPKNEVVTAINDNFVPVKLNYDQNKELAKRYRVKSIPHDVFVLPSGQLIAQSGSPSNANGYTSMLRQVTEHVEKTLAAQAPAGSGPTRPPSQLASNSQIETVPVVHPSATANRSQPTGSQSFALGDSPSATTPPPATTRISNPNFAPQGTLPGQGNLLGQGNLPGQGAFQPIQKSAGNNPLASRGGSFQPANPSTLPPTKNISLPSQLASNSTKAPSTQPKLPARSNVAPKTTSLPAPRQTAKSNLPPLGLDGYCPVTLVKERKWRKGSPQHGVIHRGRLYLFTSSVDKDQFRAAPDRFSPALSGLDSVLYTEQRVETEGKREHGVFFNDQIYLFSSEKTLEHFWNNKERYSEIVREALRFADSQSKRR